jgi:hypothetical protein
LTGAGTVTAGFLWDGRGRGDSGVLGAPRDERDQPSSNASTAKVAIAISSHASRRGAGNDDLDTGASVRTLRVERSGAPS